ncbi:hypothetical protein [Streptomyces sp. SGAir0924]|uniref:hypothetical protein n=1 Tax=Streptomyces sp. SGAir0924 TaxID=2109593 RepID=UPI0010F7E7BF|nr:hypothetical protein [Streptomyces sp. SGAir0924]
MSVPEWLGDVPTWIGASGAIGAAWFAYQTITSQRQQIGEQQAFIAEQTRFMDEQRQNLELERVALRATAEERKWAQARQVHLDEASWQTDSVSGPEDAPEPSFRGRFVLSNRSDAPVTDVEARFGDHTATEVYSWEEDRRQRRGAQHAEVRVQRLGPRRAILCLSPVVTRDTVRSNPLMTAYFTDVDGVRWSLSPNGELKEVLADGAS